MSNESIIQLVILIFTQLGTLGAGYKSLKSRHKDAMNRIERIEKKINNGLSESVSQIREDVAFLRGRLKVR
jgi:hypothetical protein